LIFFASSPALLKVEFSQISAQLSHSMRIKLECECGQRFAFDVEPINSRLPSPVECPACGADKTEPANMFLSQVSEPGTRASHGRDEPIRISIPPHAPAPVRVAVAAPTEHRAPRPIPGQTGRAQAKAEARAKISWGDPPLKVLAYLRSNGYGKEESTALVQELMRERFAAIRGKGITKVIGGSLLMCVFLGIYFIFRNGGWMSPKTLGIAGLMCLYGIWLFVNGLIMLMAPKSLPGDVEE
jgi:hypothetical protein